MATPNNPLKRITLLNPGGISIYHRSFTDEKEFDEQLFSGFTSAILSFIKEMGNELNSLSMKGMDLYFQQSSDLIIVLGIDSEFNDKETIKQMFTIVEELPSVQQVLQNLTSGILKIPPGFDKSITQALSTAISTELVEREEDLISDSEISNQLTDYLEGKIKAKKLAVELIGKNLEEKDADKKLETTQMIIDLLNSSTIEKDTREKLSKLLNEMKKSSTKAVAKVNKALF